MDMENAKRNRKKSLTKKNQHNTKKITADVDMQKLTDAPGASYSDPVQAIGMFKNEENISSKELAALHLHSDKSENSTRKKKKSIAKQDENTRIHDEGATEVEKKLYDAASNGNPSNLNQILENLRYRISDEDLENSVLKVYTELKLNNIPLVDEVELSLYELILKRCFYPKNPVISNKITDVKNHLKMLVNIIDMVSLFADEQDIFIFSLKYIAKEMYVLKHKLRSTYDRLPWEEIEFYLVVYIISVTQRHELSAFYGAILKKTNLIRYLKVFSMSLKKLQDGLIKSEETISDLSKLPDLKRSDIVHNIIENYPDFKAMYKDYHCIRDVHSLYKISKYAKFVHSTHPQEKGGNKVIIRALNVISLYLKNTLVSPKLSQITVDLILLSISEHSRTAILNLLNSGSYREAFRYRMELIENSTETKLQAFRNDVEHIGEIADDLIFRHSIRLLRQQYSQTIRNETMKEKLTPLFLYVHKELQKLPEQNLKLQCDKLLDNLKKLNSQLLSKNDPRRLQLENMITTILKPKSQQFEFHPVFSYVMKPAEQDILLQFVKSKLDSNDVEKLLSLVSSILEGDANENVNRYEIEQLCAETINLLRFEEDNDSFHKKFYETLIAHQEFTGDRRDTYSKLLNFNYQLHLSQTLRDLNIILEKSPYKKLKTEDKTFEILKSLILDVIYNVYSDEEEKENDPTLGSIWIDYLESDYELNDLLFNSFNAVFHTTNKFIQEDPKHLILNSCSETKTQKVKYSFFDYFLIVLKKQKQFTELAKGNVETFQLFLDEGADFRARDAGKSTYLHVAVKIGDVNLIDHLCNLGLSLSCKNIRSRTPLHIAAEIGEYKNVAYYISKRTKSVLSDTDDFGRTALHIAVLNQHEQIVQILIDCGSDTSVKDHLGVTALLYALLNRNEEIMELILLHDIKLGKEQNEIRTLFQDAIKQNLFDIVKFLLSNNFDILDIKNGTAAMTSAVANGRLDIIDLLLQHGADPNDPIEGEDGKTALHIAVLKEQYQIIRFLIDSGSDPFVKDDLGKSPLSYALSIGKEQIFTLLFSHEIDFSDSQRSIELQNVFVTAMIENSVELVKFLLPKIFFNLDVVTQTLAVFFAVSHGQLDMLEILLEHGADPNNYLDGCAPIIVIAAEKKLDLLVERLVFWKANVNASDPKNGMTTLHHAAKNGDNCIVDILLGSPAIDINCSNLEKQTPLHLAVLNKRLNVVKILLERRGIKVDAFDSKRYTPLLIAIENGDFNITKLLIENWAMLDNADYPVRPLDLAKAKGHEKIVQLLASHGATCSKSTKSSATTLVRNDTNGTVQKNTSPLPHKHPSILLTKQSLENPTIIIRGADRDYYKCNNDEIVKKIIEQNRLERSIKYKLQIIKKNEKEDSCSIIIVLDKTIYKEILDKKKLNIGWKSCSVSDYSYLYRCYRCAGFGHIHTQCENEEICGQCSEKHSMKECTSTDFQCINCIRKKEELGLHLDIFHSAFDQFCPCYRKLLDEKYKKQMKYSKLNR